MFSLIGNAASATIQKGTTSPVPRSSSGGKSKLCVSTRWPNSE